MIFGSEGIEGTTYAVKSLLKIFISEAALGFCNRLSVKFNTDNSFVIKSFDRGFLLSDEIINDKPSWYYDFCELYHPNWKLDEDYYFSLGEHHNQLYGDAKSSEYPHIDVDTFFDLTCVQYVSEYMSVEASRDNILKTLRFEKGYCVRELETKESSNETYTQIEFKLDVRVFGTNSVYINEIIDFLRNSAITIPNLMCEFINETDNTNHRFIYPQGLNDFITKHVETIAHTPIYFRELTATGKDRYNRKEYTGTIRVAVCFCSKQSLTVCFHNHCKLHFGGRHLERIKEKITDYFKCMFDDIYGKGTLSFSTLFDNLIIAVETKCENYATSWENTTKKAITNKMLDDMASDIVDDDFQYYLKKNKLEILKIVGI